MNGKSRKHSKRWTALEVIRTEWAKHGKDTQASMRAFIENRVSKDARDEAARLGLRQYKSKNPCPRPARKNVSRKAIKRAAGLSQRFHGFRPRRLTAVNVTWPKALVLLGHVVRLDYLSDKEDGKVRCYTHDFKQPVSVFASGSAKTGQKNILLLHGNFSIVQEGIVG